MTNYKQLNKEQRNTIEQLINKGESFTNIGNAIKVDRTTVAKEIKRNRIIRSSYFSIYSDTGINRAIKGCDKLSKPPYCCNNCKSKNYCSKYHLYYNATAAQKHYEESLSESRKGIDITNEEIEIINKNIVPLVKQKNKVLIKFILIILIYFIFQKQHFINT